MTTKKSLLAAVSGDPARRRVTIADVARKAGVSKATVSRFFNHRERLLTPDIAARVAAAVAALEYQPSPMASALKKGRSRLIGLVVADVTNPYSVAVLRGAERACQEAGYLVMLFNLGNDSSREREAVAALSSYQVEGFILNATGGEADGVAEATRHGKPAVLIDRRHDGAQADFVSLDNAGAMRLAVNHLADAGYREILLVSEPLKGVSSRIEREAAFRFYVNGHSAGLRGDCFESVEDDGAGLAAALQALRMRATGNPAAVVSGNAVVTLRVARAVAAAGWQFGRELGLVAFDETEWAPLIGPGLSTIAQPTDDLGRVAATCLIERLDGLSLPPRQVLLPGQLLVRGSSRSLT